MFQLDKMSRKGFLFYRKKIFCKNVMKENKGDNN